MAQDRLIVATAAVVVTGGVAAEVAAPSTALLTIGDLAAGTGLALAAALLARTRPSRAWVAVACAALWFAATLSGADVRTLASFGSLVLFVHRGPALHLALGTTGTARRVGVVSVYIASLLPQSVAGPATGVAALLVATAALVRAGRSRRGWIALGTAVVAATLGSVWLLADHLSGRAILFALVDDGALIVLAALAAADRAPRSSALVLELAPDRDATAPVLERLSRVLGDPDLVLAFRLPGDVDRWVDETGRSLAAPAGAAVTRASAPDGGEVALLHGARFSGDPALSRAAARAAVLALDTARLDAEARLRTDDLRASRARLLAAADDERRSLEQRLTRGPLRRLERVRQTLADLSDTAVLRTEVTGTIDDLRALAAGLFPAAGGLERTLAVIAGRAPVPVDLEVSIDPTELPDDQARAVCFVVSEALANVARHAHATRASVLLRHATQGLVLTVTDDGQGGATAGAGRGLAGLAERAEVLGGRLTITSPAGGPTVIEAMLPAGDGPLRA